MINGLQVSTSSPNDPHQAYVFLIFMNLIFDLQKHAIENESSIPRLDTFLESVCYQYKKEFVDSYAVWQSHSLQVPILGLAKLASDK